MGSIDDGVFEGKALTLVDGNRPKPADICGTFLYRLLYLLGLLIDRIFRIHPLHLLQLKPSSESLLRTIILSPSSSVSHRSPHQSYHYRSNCWVVLDKRRLSGLQGEHKISRINDPGSYPLPLPYRKKPWTRRQAAAH